MNKGQHEDNTSYVMTTIKNFYIKIKTCRDAAIKLKKQEHDRDDNSRLSSLHSTTVKQYHWTNITNISW